MSVRVPAAASPPVDGERTTSASRRADPGYQAFVALRVLFAAAPIAFGLDKFFDITVEWSIYLAPWIDDIIPGDATDAMRIVGVIEIVAGLTVAVIPRYGAIIVAAWLAGIIVNLLTLSGYYDIALRDAGLMVGALTLARLAWAYDAPRAVRR